MMYLFVVFMFKDEKNISQVEWNKNLEQIIKINGVFKENESFIDKTITLRITDDNFQLIM